MQKLKKTFECNHKYFANFDRVHMMALVYHCSDSPVAVTGFTALSLRFQALLI